jgi:RNA polymerase sigma-70 factor (ECF subfamily)
VANTILQRIAQGEKTAVQECLSRYGGLVWSLARRFLGNATEAEDAVQDIFVELWKNAEKYNPSLSSEPTYVTMVTRRRLIDRRRKIVRRPELVQLPEAVVSRQQPGSNQIDMIDEAAQAAAALQELKPEQQRVLKLAVYQGLTHEEISQSTGLPLGTVKTHARRGLIKLREMLGAEQPKIDAVSSIIQGGL